MSRTGKRNESIKEVISRLTCSLYYRIEKHREWKKSMAELRRGGLEKTVTESVLGPIVHVEI